jgi:PAS domain S-box-containing protein
MSEYPDRPPLVSDEDTSVFRSSLELLYEIGREVTADLDLRTLLHRVLFLTMKNVGAISGSIIVIDEDGQPGESALLILGQTHQHTALQLRVTYEHGLAGWVARHRQAVLVEDTNQDERWLPRQDDLPGKAASKSAVSVPILARENLVGVMTFVHPQPGFFTQSHLSLVEAIADWAGTAILHARLIDRLQSANRRYRELFEDSIDSILISDWQGAILELNRQAQKMLGVRDGDSRTLSIADLNVVDPDRVGPDLQNLRNGGVATYEAQLRSQQGALIPVQVVAREIRDGSETHLQWILRDLSERKDLDRLREDLTAMIYHDLRSPLGNIISSLDMLAVMLTDQQDEAAQSMLEIAQRSTERIDRLTSSLLDIHRLESGQPVGARQPARIQDLLEDALAAIQPALDAKKHTLSLNIDLDAPPVWMDAEMIKRVLINLFDNAVKFSPEDGLIQVDIRKQGAFMQTSVQDSGPGIQAHYQERIFEKFTRVGLKDGPKGLGLGLAFCRLAVAAHGGRIWVESEPGKGAAFRFTLPLAESDGSQ